ISKEEQDRGTMGISFPILDASHENVAALTVSGPLERFGSEKKFFLKTKITAEKISEDLGYNPQKKINFI
ncbi:MAG TPA: IclR family transcriptional regulator C-terminal domain-containing protein, partial [Virgibacillus sp.]